MHMKIMSDKWASMARSQYDKVVAQNMRNDIVHSVKRKYLCSDWNITNIYFAEYQRQNMHS